MLSDGSLTCQTSRMPSLTTSSKRRVRPSARSTTVTIRLEQALDDRLQAAAKAAGKPVSQVIRDAAHAHLVTLEVPNVSPTATSASPASALELSSTAAAAVVRRLDVLETSGRRRDAAQREAIDALERQVEQLGSLLKVIGQRLGVNIPTAAVSKSEPDSRAKAGRAGADLNEKLLNLGSRLANNGEGRK